MKTNQNTIAVLLFSIVLMWLSYFQGYGQQGEIIRIESNGNPENQVSLVISPPIGKGDTKEITVKKRTSNQSGTMIEDGSIIEVPSKVSITLKSSHTNELRISGPKVVEYRVKSNSENYRVLDENDDGFLNISVFKKLLGSVTSANATGTLNGSARFTEWSVENDSAHFKFELIKGEVAINNRTKIQIRDNILEVGDSLNRVLYVDETVELINPKNPNFTIAPDSHQEKWLETDNDINSFFKTEHRKQKHILKSGGPNSAKGYKGMEQGEFDEGISNYEKAIELGEIDTDKFIQGALILVESYLNDQELKDRAVWLDAALHFIKISEAVNKAKYEHFNERGMGKIAKAFGNDWALSKEYYAWAYTVKLKLNNCLEHADQNPLSYIKEASQLREQIKDY